MSFHVSYYIICVCTGVRSENVYKWDTREMTSMLKGGRSNNNKPIRRKFVMDKNKTKINKLNYRKKYN